MGRALAARGLRLAAGSVGGRNSAAGGAAPGMRHSGAIGMPRRADEGESRPQRPRRLDGTLRREGAWERGVMGDLATRLDGPMPR